MAITRITDYVIEDGAVNVSKLDVTPGSAGQVLSIDGSGNLLFVTRITTEEIQDAAAQMILDGTHTNLSVTYDDNGNTLSLNASGAVTSVNTQTGAVVLDSDDINEGTTNLYYTDGRVNTYLTANNWATETYVDNAVAGKDHLSELSGTTDDVTEGLTNLYFTETRARQSISASGDLTYVAGTGVISFTERTDTEVRGLISHVDNGGDGSLSYNSTTGVITYTGPSALEVRAHFTGGTGVTITNGTIAIGQDVSPTSDVTFNDVQVDGDLTVLGTTTTVLSSTTRINENILYLNEGGDATITNAVGNGSTVTFTADNTYSTGYTVDITGVNPTSFNVTDATITAADSTSFTISSTVTDTYVSGGEAYGHAHVNVDLGWAGAYDDGTYHHAGFFRDASDGRFKAFDSYTPEPGDAIDIDTSHASFSLADIQADTFYGAFSGNLTGDVTGQADTVASLTGLDTDDLAEGSTNLYYTDTKARLALSASGDITYNSSTGVISFTAAASPVTSVNTQTGAVVLDTGDVSEGSNLYFTDTRARSAISVSGDLTYSPITGVISYTGRTDLQVKALFSAGGDLSYNASSGTFSFTERTDAEVKGLISATGDISYNNGTGVISYTERTDGEVRGLISVSDTGGDGSLSYNSSTGVIEYAGPTATEIRSHFTTGTGVFINVPGELSIGQDVSTTSNVTFNNVTVDGTLDTDDITATSVTASGDVTITGDLTVNGTTTYLNTTDLLVEDNIITLNSNWPALSAPTINAGIEVERGTEPTVSIEYNESSNKWTFTNDGTTYQEIGSLTASDTDDLGEGTTNLYYTDTRSRNALSVVSTGPGSLAYNSTTGTFTYTGPTDLDIRNKISASGSLLYNPSTGVMSYSTPNTIASLSNHDTDDLVEGTNNLYYTDGRVDGRFDTRLALKTTDDLTEGTSNLYWTSTRGDTNFATNIAASTTDDLPEGTTALYYTQTRVDDRVDVLRLGLSTSGGDSVHFDNLTSVPVVTTDTITGDGITNTFTLSATPGSVDAVIVTVSGATQTPTLDYTISSNSITFTSTLPNLQKAYVRHVGYQISGGTVVTATDSQLLDGIDSTQFLRSDVDDTMVGDLTMTGDIVPSADDTYDLGSSSNQWANVYGRSIEATFADLAERYATDAPYEPGTVVVYGGEAEITLTSQRLDVSVAGVISTDPALKLNSNAGNSQTHPYVALRGRVPCKVIGPVNKGDLLVTSGTPGFAKSVGKVDYGVAVFAKSITTDLSGGEKIVEVVII